MNNPKIRFKGYTDAWEQRKVSDLLEERNEQSPESEEYPLMAFIANEGVAPKGERYDRGALVKDAKNKNYKKAELGDFIYSSNNLETGSIGLNNYGKASISPVYSIFKPTGIADSDFIGRRFVRKDFINAMVKWRQGVVYGQWRIHESDFLKIEVAVPSLAEQRKIGAYLAELDHLITLHQRKCDQIKKLKKYMLQKLFPQDGKNIPEIRFEGFTNAWEQRKLGDVFAERTERANGDEELLSVTIGNGVIRQVDLDKRNIASENKSNYKIVHKGDVPYNSMRMWQGAVGNSEYDGIVSPAYTVLVPTTEANGKFFMELFKKETTLKIFQRWSQGLTSDTWNLKYPVLSSIEFYMPAIEEQTKIAEYFQILDELITLHQRKCEELQKIKKYMLQNMFV